MHQFCKLESTERYRIAAPHATLVLMDEHD